MIGGEHRKERYSERIEGAQNQPRNRGYLPGTGVISGGYSTATLLGNWQEERADAAYYDGKAVLPTESTKLWTTTYREATAPVEWRALAEGRLARKPQDSFDQATMMEIVDRTQSSYPGHQPHLNTQRAEIAATAMQTMSQMSYVPPAAAAATERAQTRPVLGGTPGAQATGVLQHLRRQLKGSLPNSSAFPGNVMRTVRQMLVQSARGGGSGGRGRIVAASSAAVSALPAVNAEELQAGLALVGVEASPPACTALIRYFDTTGNDTACVDTLVSRLRGELTDRRLQLMRSVYALLATIAAADAVTAGGGGDGLVRLTRLCDLVDVTQLPRVMNGEVCAEDARAAFAAQWDAGVSPTSSSPSTPPPASIWAPTRTGASTRAAPSAGMLVTEVMFVEYFSDASFEMESEGDFERMMRNVWHLSGGNGSCENTSCRRAKVVHLSGRVSTVEVKNDLAIKGSGTPEVNELIRAALEKQGIKDIKSFTVL